MGNDEKKALQKLIEHYMSNREMSDTPANRQAMLMDLLRAQQTALTLLLMAFRIDLPATYFNQLFNHLVDDIVPKQSKMPDDLREMIDQMMRVARDNVEERVRSDQRQADGINDTALFNIAKLSQLASTLLMATSEVATLRATGIEVDSAFLDLAQKIVEETALTPRMFNDEMRVAVRANAKSQVLVARKRCREDNNA